MKIKRRKLHPAEQYVDDVINNRIVSCELVKKACLRYLDDKRNAKRKGIYLDKKSAQKAIEEEIDLESNTTSIFSNSERKFVKDTDQGNDLRKRITALKALVEAYKAGLIKGE